MGGYPFTLLKIRICLLYRLVFSCQREHFQSFGGVQKKNAVIKQFLEEVKWGELDYLIIDTPPGTSDEHITIGTLLRDHGADGAVLVTTPQAVSLSDVAKEINFCQRIGLPVLGLVENMSGYQCPCCNEITNIFSTGGGESLCNLMSVPFMGRIPIDPEICDSAEKGEVLKLKKSIQPLETFVANGCRIPTA